MYAQSVPQGMKYQAVARDLSGEILPNQSIALKVHLQSNINEPIVHYTEVHTITTNQMGLFSLIIGKGKIEVGVFDDIPWSTEDIWMEIAIKNGNESNFSTISNSKLLAVPYAFHAATAAELVGDDRGGNGNGNGNTPGVPSQVWSLFGNSNTDATKDKLGTTDLADLVMITNNIERLRITSGGNIEIANDLDVGNDLHVGNDATIDNNVDLNATGGETNNHGDFTVNNASSTVLTGTLEVDSATTLNSSVHVVGATQFDSNINVDASTVTDKLVVSDETSPDPTPRYGSLADIRGLFVADSISIVGGLDIGGNLKVHGDSVIIDHHMRVGGNSSLQGTVNIDGATTVNNTLDANGQVTVNANVSGGDGSYGAYPLRVEGSDQGVAIKLNTATANNSNNFITFFNSSGTAMGRIEGETTSEVATTPEFIFDNSILVAEEVKAIAAIPLAAIPVVVAGVGASAGPCGGCIAIAAADLFLKSANLIAYNAFALSNLGVSYQSGSADYAEWLERSNPDENMTPGEIVGVNSGKISKYTLNAQQYMVISTKPAILGNMPAPGQEGLFEKVAFMGQIPVRVRGIVISGDYILPSGRNDGTGIAVSPDEITSKQYREIVGVAWSSVLIDNGVNIINMAIGLNANDVANLAIQQEEKIKAMENRFTVLEARLLALENGTAIASTEVSEDAASIKKVDLPKKEISRSEIISSYMPAELSDDVMREAIIYLENEYRTNGINIEEHPGLNRLFNDDAYQAEIIKKTQETYKTSRQNLLNSTKNTN